MVAEPRPYDGLELSPDGLRVATEIRDPNNSDIWVYDLARDIPTQFTRDPSRDLNPVWTPDGDRVLWSGQRDGQFDLFSKAADGTGEAEQLTNAEAPQGPSSFSPDGRTLVFWQGTAQQGTDTGIMSMDDEQKTEWLFDDDFAYGHSQVSPDGRWIAYDSNEEGQAEIYVRPFPNVDGDRVKISQDGGFSPLWGPNSDELFFQAYQGADRSTGTVTMMVAPVETEPTLSPETPMPLFSGPYRAGELVLNAPRPYDVSPDGQRFLIIKEPTGAEAGGQDIILIQHFDEELTRLFPDP